MLVIFGCAPVDNVPANKLAFITLAPVRLAPKPKSPNTLNVPSVPTAVIAV
jgi:hypothetical protein